MEFNCSGPFPSQLGVAGELLLEFGGNGQGCFQATRSQLPRSDWKRIQSWIRSGKNDLHIELTEKAHYPSVAPNSCHSTREAHLSPLGLHNVTPGRITAHSFYPVVSRYVGSGPRAWDRTSPNSAAPGARSAAGFGGDPARGYVIAANL